MRLTAPGLYSRGCLAQDSYTSRSVIRLLSRRCHRRRITLRRKHAAIISATAVQDKEESDRLVDFKAQAESAYATARKLVPAVEDAKRQAAELHLKADIAERNAREAEAHAATVVPEAQGAVRELRILAADIRGQEEELGTAMLDCLAVQLLNEWLVAHPQAAVFQVVDRYEVGVGGVKGTNLVARVAAVEDGSGKRSALVAFASGERVPSGDLGELQVHWGCAAQEGWGWEPPPRGWTSAPHPSKEAGKAGQAWRTPFRRYAPTFLDEPITLITAYAAALQLPLDGVIREGGGISFVLHRPSKRPEWLRSTLQRDFFISCKKVADRFEQLDKGVDVAVPSLDLEGLELPPDVKQLLIQDAIREGRVRPSDSMTSMHSGSDSDDDNLADKVERLIQEVELSTVKTLTPNGKPVSLEDLPVSIAEFISAIWGPKNTLLNGKLVSSPAVSKLAHKLLNGQALERLTGNKGSRQRDSIGLAQGPEERRALDAALDLGRTSNNKPAANARLIPAVPLNAVLSTWAPLEDGTASGSSVEHDLVVQFYSAVHLVDVALLQAAPGIGNGVSTARLEAMRSKAEAIVESARDSVYDAESCSLDASMARQEAEQLRRLAGEAHDMSVKLQESAADAVRTARKAIARLKGKEEEVAIADLHQVAAERLLATVDAVQRGVLVTDTTEAAATKGTPSLAIPPVKPVVSVSQVHGLDAHMVTHAMMARHGEQYYMAVSVAAAEVFPDGGLDGCLMHWGCVTHFGGTWLRPPKGWRSDPDRSFEKGSAWQTPLKKMQAPGYEDRDDISVHVATLIIPLYKDGKTSGVDFVIKTPQDKWLARCDTNKDGRSNFYVDFHVAAEAVRGVQLDAAADEAVDPQSEEAEVVVSADRFAELASVDSSKLADKATGITRKAWDPQSLIMEEGDLGAMRGWGVADWMVDLIVGSEPKAERSLMHRFDIASDLLSSCVQRGDMAMPLLALTVWLRYSSARYLVWNRNYNVKPREISAAQDRLTGRLTQIYEEQPGLRDLCLLALSAIGSGGTGDAGQRIRDEILHIQSKNGCKGGMMEQWHQKLHNNTSPDDVIICEALMAYLRADMDLSVYWDILHKGGITKERLASYDRAITAEPDLRPGQKAGLLKDLGAYLLTLKAVHTGADLQAAAARVTGYSQTSVKGRAVTQEPVAGVKGGPLEPLLQAALVFKELDSRGQLRGVDDILRYLEVLNEARRELRVITNKGNTAAQGRLRDLLYLDLALVNATRTLVESKLDGLKDAASNPAYLVPLLLSVSLFVESVCMTVGGNRELVCCLEEMQAMQSKAGQRDLFLLAQSVTDRLTRALGNISEAWSAVLQPTAGAVGWRLGVPQEAIDTFSEEVIRGTAFAPLSQLLSLVDPALRKQSGRGNWMIISPASGSAQGWVQVVEDLASVQHDTFDKPTVLLSQHVGGEEEVPEGTVALLTPDSVDVLCHSSVRARNCKVFMATCYEKQELEALRELEGAYVRVTSSPADGNVKFEAVAAEPPPSAATSRAGQSSEGGTAVPSVHVPQLQKREWCGRWVIGSHEFHHLLVGAKSINTLTMSRKLPHWVRQPPSLAIPFGTFERTLEEPCNAAVAKQILKLSAALPGHQGNLAEDLNVIRDLVLQLDTPDGFREMFRDWCFDSNICYPGWGPCWSAIKQVWASQWNDRAYVSLDKAGLRHSDLQMAVLVQPVVPAEYAFVAHTTNPTTRNENELYLELVKGFGETLVGNHPGTAMRVSADKQAVKRDLALRDYLVQYKQFAASEGDTCQVLTYPSKSSALLLQANECDGVMIFRSDSNGEDLDGYAGAGLFDSVMTKSPALVPVNYSKDRLMCDKAFQQEVLNSIAAACVEIETLMGGQAQDIEGVVMTDGTLYVVQTRPQV